MKKLRNKIENFVLKTEDRWKVIPYKRQRFLVKVFFGGYVLITIIVIAGICISTSERSNRLPIDHIEGISKKKTDGKDVSQHDLTETSFKN